MQAINILSDLKSKGHKNTPVRKTLIEILSTSKAPLSIQEVLDLLGKKNLVPNKTTIYREIDFLKSQGILQEVEFGEGKKKI